MAQGTEPKTKEGKPKLTPVPGAASGNGADSPVEGAPAQKSAKAAKPAAEPVAQRPGLTPPSRRGGSGRYVTDHIVELGYASKDRVEEAIAEARARGMTAEAVLLEDGVVNTDQLARATSERFGLDHLDLNTFELDLGAVNLVPSTSAKRFQAVPVAFVDEDTLLVAMSDPTNVRAVDDISIMTGRDVRPAVASEEDIAAVISHATQLDESIAEAIEEEDEEEDDGTQITDIREASGDAPVVKLVNSVIAKAVEEGASDIHFQPEGKEVRVRYRVDGVLHDTTTVPKKMVAGVVSRLKIMADLDIAEKRLPQDGRVGLTVSGHPVDIRMSCVPSVKGEKLVLRILDKEQALIGLERLGMQEDTLERFNKGFTRSYGATFVTGPTGSGKTTSLYAALNVINTPEKNIVTVEDPVEYQLPGMTQIQTNSRAGLTFASGLRSIVRSDPDVIMVGEIRDSETAQIAVEAALTGHLVLSTMHTNDAPTAITRLSEMGIQPFLTASALDVVISQRLVRLLCPHCKKRVVIPADALSNFNIPYDLEAYEAKGCKRCGFSGYKGRVGLYEAMTVSEELRKLTIERASADEIREVAIEQGMRPLEQDGIDKVRLGITTIEEVARVTGSAMAAD
ncbi:MAG: ATPase, T2SS/T4P/T4SS family [Solirubrobacterales bacterium]